MPDNASALNEEALLVAAAAELKLQLPDQFVSQIAAYLDLLVKWNQSYNLTAIRDRREMLIKHIIDSLSIAPYVQGNRLLDVGTGGGLPGIPLALLFPEKRITLLDSNAKKIAFLRKVISALQLQHVDCIDDRVEHLNENNDTQYDVLVTRAALQPEVLLAASKNLLTSDGQWLMMRSSPPEQLPADATWAALTVPYLDAARGLLVINRT